mgnify:FL=1|jgi:hypothetical protein
MKTDMGNVVIEHSSKLRAQELLSRFFFAPNLFSLTSLDEEGKLVVFDGLVGAIEHFETGANDRPVLLPMLVEGDPCVTWVALCFDERMQRAVAAEMMAFIGPTYVTELFHDDPAGGSEAVRSVLSADWPHVVLMRSTKENHNTRVAQLWATRWKMWDWQPARPSFELRSFAQLRASFDRALLARNERAALDAMAALRQAHGLSAENRAFLEVRLAAAFGRWQDIVEHDQWAQVLQLRLPPETYGDVWEALYEVHLRQFELAGQLASLVAAFEREVRVIAAPLLRAIGSSRRPAALKCFVLNELCQSEPSQALLESLIGQLEPLAFGPCSDEVRGLLDRPKAKQEIDAALVEIDRERYEQAFAMLWPMDDSPAVLTAILRCAREIDDPARSQDTLNRLKATAFESELRQLRPRLIEAVERAAAGRISAGTAVAVTIAEPILPEATEEPGEKASDNAIVDWWREIAHADGRVLLDQPKLMEQLIFEIEAGAIEEGPRFELLLPVWFEWLVDRTEPMARLISVYLSFIEGLFARNQLGDSELEMMRLATTHLLRAGPRPDQYRDAVNRLVDVFQEVRSPNALDWALDIADCLSSNPCRDDDARHRWLGVVFDTAQQGRERLRPTQRALLRLLARESGIELAGRFDEPASSNAADVPAGQRVLIYSLDDQANQRAALTLQEMLADCRVESNADDSCTKRLHNSARSAQVVAFVSSVATHAAFFCIKGAVKSSDSLLQVPGSGTTRIVQSVLDRLLR